MMWRDVISLIPTLEGRDSYGDETETDGDPREVFANKKSVRQSEFYQALAAGLKPEIVFEVREQEYQDEKKARYGETDYHIIRTFSRNGEILELVCSRYPMEG
ncbi:phage head closure protein [Cohnella sp. AR92]|uniref:phage head closure protein n=1 Tax=Cohnella sp. AR92 TaxID=648716 RepID=UPI000F8DE5E9|nr:phage head closure protein [Cohnella sp. AR92]RUS47562.1 phage head-tail adapter protein [Cohnella sp. AR92]